MRKVYLFTAFSLLFITSCSKTNTSSTASDFKSDDISSDSNTSSKTSEDILKNFLDRASYNYSMKCTVDEYTNYYGVKTSSKNYMDIASKDDYFSITKYSQVFDGMGTINRNTIDSDIRYKSYEYEGEKVVSSSYLNMKNEICYTIHKDSYGYTTAWDTSFKSFFDDLTVYDFSSDDEITYTLNVSKLSENLTNEILYQLGCLSVSKTTTLHIDSVSLVKENDSFSKMNFTFIDDEDDSVYTKYTIVGDIVVGNKSEGDVKVEEVVTGESIEELDKAFKSLAAYNFDFNLKVTISRTEQKEYATSASSDGNKIVSSKFAYVQSSDGLDYYYDLTDGSKAYKTMNRISGGSLKDVLPSFDISTYFFTKAASNTYILSNKAKRCSVSSKDLSVYQPFSLSFSSLTIKLGEDSLSLTGINGSYQFDISYTNIGKVSPISFTGESTLGYGDYLEYYSWSYSDYIDTYATQLNTSNSEETYSILNNIPTYYSYISSLPSFVSSSSMLGIEYEYSNTVNRDTDYSNIISFYKDSGFTLSSTQTGTSLLTKKITIGEVEKTLSLTVMTGKAYEIPIIGVFPSISN